MEKLKKITPYLGWSGVLCFIGAAFCYRFLIDRAAWSVTAFIGAGFLCVAGYIVFEWQNIAGLFRRRAAQGTLNTGVVVLASLAILGILNYIAVGNNKRFDFTAANVFTLAEQSRNVARSLDANVEVYAFLDPNVPDDRHRFDDLMSSYRNETSRLVPTVVDPLERRDLVERYKVGEFGVVVFDKGGNVKRAKAIDEESFTRTLIELTTGAARAVYFLTGHGEYAREGDGLDSLGLAAQRLESMNYAVKEMSLLKEFPAVPDDAAAVVIAAPKSALLAAERAVLTDYVEKRGGRLLVMLERSSPKEWREWLVPWGIIAHNATVIDPVGNSVLGSYFVAAVSRYSPVHPATKNFELAAFLPTTLPLETVDTAGIDVSGIAFSSDAAWGDADTKVWQFDEAKDVKGPLTLAVSATLGGAKIASENPDESAKADGADKKKEGRVVVTGDADFASNGYQQLSGNMDLFTNLVNWLAEQDTLIGIAPNKRTASMVQMSRTEVALMWYSVVYGLPLAVLAAGGFVWWRRRKL